jgi:2-deoxy-D-gluconate 3-dehydrogenase
VGIGRAIAFRLAEAGAGMMITDIDVEAASQTAMEIKARGWKAHAIRANAGNTADAKMAVRATVKAFGCLDILVNNAGIYPMSPVLETSEQIWDKVLNINLKGVFFYSQAAAHEMVEAEHGGRIINMASIDAMHPYGGVAHYGTSEAGVVMLTKALALELAPHNILINAVALGSIMTPGTQATRAVLQAQGIPEEKVLESFRARLPLGRMGEPDDIAKVVLFLASAAADYMTGSVILVDGGYLLS